MRVKWIAVLTLLIVLASLAAGGCKKEAAGLETVIMWTHGAENPDFLAATEAAIAKFQEANPNITVKLENFTYDVFIQKLRASFAAGDEADVLQIFGTWATDYARKGYLDPVPDTIDTSGFFPASLGGYTWQGKLYGLPHEYNLECGGMLVHPAMFQEADLEYPQTWADLVAAAKALTKRDTQGLTRAGFIFTSLDNIVYSFLSFILQQGADYWNGDQTAVDFSTPEAQTAWKALLDLIVVAKVEDPSLVSGEEDTSDYFYKGQAAMCYRGPWTIAAGLNSYNLSDFDYVPVPPFAGETMVFAAESGWGEIVSARSQHKAAAWKLVEFLTTDSALAWNLRSFTLPARQDVAADPAYIEQAGPLMATPLTVLEGGRWIGPLWDRDRFFDILNRHFLAAAAGLETYEASLKAVETELNAMLAENQ